MTAPRRLRRVQIIPALMALPLLCGVSTALAATAPPLRLVAAAKSVTAYRYPGEPGVFLDLGTHLIAGATRFEIRVKRKSYADPLVATRVWRKGGQTTTKVLPAGLVADWGGLSNFLHLRIVDQAGDIVVDENRSFCPNTWSTVRTRPTAPDRSPYPQWCDTNPFTRGAVWGIQAGWSANTSDRFGSYVALPDGSYTAHVYVTRAHRRAFGIPLSAAEATVQLTVRTMEDSAPPPPHPGVTRTGSGRSGSALPAARPGPRPTGAASVPDGTRRDLRSLPAWGIAITSEERPGAASAPRQFLAFNANAWNAGPSPLVVDGFRREGEDLMDAYQYFYDASGRQTGWARAGTLEYDVRDGHEHWHFTDFASYRLLGADRKLVVRSQKEAFCLAPTDGIDLTVTGAQWKPRSTGLETACGDKSSMAIRETVDVGWGDTYAQYVPGQSFDITDLPDGTYYIQVVANPDRRLYERSTRNNVSYRKVVLGTAVGGARTVTVPPHYGVDAP
jgi:hypothetical protein